MSIEGKNIIKTIDTGCKGVYIHVLEGGDFVYEIDNNVWDPEIQAYVLEYIETDRVAFDDKTPKEIITKVLEMATAWGSCDRLVTVCKSRLEDNNSKKTITESKWWSNQARGLTLYRDNNGPDHMDLTDLSIRCVHPNGTTVDIVRCDHTYLCALFKYFENKLHGRQLNIERKTQTVTVENCTGELMEHILRFAYTREYTIPLDDAITAWFISDKYIAPDLTEDVESAIMKNLHKSQVETIRPIAEQLNSKRVLQLIEDIIASGDDLTSMGK